MSGDSFEAVCAGRAEALPWPWPGWTEFSAGLGSGAFFADAEGQRNRLGCYLPPLILSGLRLAAPCCVSCSGRQILLGDELSFADVDPSASWPRGGLRSAQERFF